MNNNNSNVICTYNGIQIYENDISVLCHEYESKYDNSEDILNNTVFFTGLMVFIQQRLFKPISDSKYNNDYNALDKLFFSVFIPLSVKYKRTPTIQNFCVMTSISNSLLSEILTGNYRDGSKVKTETCETVQKWYQTVESALASKAIDTNGIGSIFALKSNFSWRETSPEPPTAQTLTQSTPEQIAERYKDAKRPEIPVLD